MGRRSFFVVFVTMAGSLSSATWANSRAAIEAWNAGDFPLAIQEWQEPAQRGDAEAQFRLGEAYRLGKGVEQDLIKAEEMFARAAAQGHLEAANNYGLLLFHRGEKKQALPYLRAASERGDARAQYLLGLAYFNADNVERDWPRAYALVNLARKQGLEQAVSALQQIDQHITPEVRSQGLLLAHELQSRVDGKPASLPPQTTPALASAKAGTVHRNLAAQSARAGAQSIAARRGSTIAKPETRAAGRWRVQLGSFAQPGNADLLWNRVRNRAELTGRPRVKINAGKTVRLQAAGFPDRPAAQSACDRLKSAGFDCFAISG